MSSRDILADLTGFKKWGGILLSVTFAITADVLFPGWGRFTGTTCLLITVQVLLWRRFWVQPRFWALLSLFVALHLVFFLKARLWINSIDPFSWFAVTMAEVLVSAFILSFTDRSLRPHWAGGPPYRSR